VHYYNTDSYDTLTELLLLDWKYGGVNRLQLTNLTIALRQGDQVDIMKQPRCRALPVAGLFPVWNWRVIKT